MHMRKDGEIALDDDQMSGHAHVRFEVRGWFAVFREAAEAQKYRLPRAQRLAAKIPLPTALIRQRQSHPGTSLTRRRGYDCFRIVPGGRIAGHFGKLQSRCHGVWKTG